MSGSAEILLDVRGLKTFFDIKAGGGRVHLKAVNGITLSIKRGETFGLVGESGCGKTTVGRTLLKLHKPAGGRIIYGGRDITNMSDAEFFPYRRKMQMIFQDPYTSLDPRQPVSEIIGAPLTLHKLVSGRAKRESRVRELIHMLGLRDDHINRYPHEFSGGQRQRIGIARAFALEPEFIVCDEPVSALDISIQAQVINILEDFQRKLGVTYLFISHDLSVVRHISHNVGVMYLGRLVETASAHELYSNMRHPYTQSLLSAALTADPAAARDRKRKILPGDVPSLLKPPPGCPFHQRCARAADICAAENPAPAEVSPGHVVACHNML